MFNSVLTTAVEQFAATFVHLPEADLERPWAWKGHDEGLRFAFFVTHLELRQLAIKLADMRTPPQPAHRILGQYHAAYLDLQATLAGITVAQADQAPSEQDWPVHKVLAHIVSADLGFSAIVRYALEGHRAGTWTPARIPETEYPRLVGLSEKEYDELFGGPYTPLLAYYRNLHPQLLTEFAAITPAELDLPAAYWEPEPFPLSYRLLRFEAHLRQHTIQVDKTLAAIGLAPTEPKRLIRMLYNALAEVEANLIGTGEGVAVECDGLAAALKARVEEIDQILQK